MKSKLILLFLALAGLWCGCQKDEVAISLVGEWEVEVNSKHWVDDKLVSDFDYGFILELRKDETGRKQDERILWCHHPEQQKVVITEIVDRPPPSQTFYFAERLLNIISTSENRQTWEFNALFDLEDELSEFRETWELRRR